MNHTSLLGFLLSDMGAWGTPLMYAFRERERVLDLFESLSGSRMMCDYMRFGGCRVDLPPGWMEQARDIVDGFPRFLDEFEKLITGNEIVIARTQEVGKLSTELAINAGITGPGLRASGVNYDLRKVDGYGIYPRFEFRVPLGEHGDCYDRLMMRVLELRESLDHSPPGDGRNCPRVRSESEGKNPRLQTAGRRSLRPDRGAERRARLLLDQRR